MKGLDSRSRRVLGELRRILGPGDVVVDEFVVGLYSRNAAGMSSKALAVVFPRSVEQVSRIVRLAYRESVPIYPQGSATELTGSSLPSERGIVVS
ncbi:MAG: FAD-binding protein, partial [Candidatus Korarchaeota archaeon]|nr:FAD-binding protein [Candidatus Korarchaeota archaeon]